MYDGGEGTEKGGKVGEREGEQRKGSSHSHKYCGIIP